MLNIVHFTYYKDGVENTENEGLSNGGKFNTLAIY